MINYINSMSSMSNFNEICSDFKSYYEKYINIV